MSLGSTVLEVVDVGLSTFGLVAGAAAVRFVLEENGLLEAVVAAVGLVLAVLILGATGVRAARSVDDVVGGIDP
jgi:hypothetical protein